MSINEKAVALSKAGYAVFPTDIRLDNRGKKKPTNGQWSRAKPGLMVPEWTSREYGAAYLNCEASGIVVVDIDLHDDVDGRAALEDAGIAIPQTPMQIKTWSGGQHLFFRQPLGEPIGSHQGVPAAGVDIRGLGGAVFSPYSVVLGLDDSIAGSYDIVGQPTKAADLPRLPEDFAEAVRAHQRRDQTAAETTLEPYTGELSEFQRNTLERWMEEDLQAIRVGSSGERHRLLLSKAAKVMDRAVKLGYSTEQAVQLVQDAYEQSGGTEWEEKSRVVEWAAERLAQEPLGVPVDWATPDEVRFEEAVAAKVEKIRVDMEARRRATYVSEEVDLGRELDFSEPPGGLYGKHWVKDVIPSGETTLVFAERNVGKSFLAISLGLSVASGEAWYGRPVTRGNVLYLAGEGAVGLPARRRAWCAHNGLGNPENFRLRDRIVRLGNPASLEAWQKVIVDQEIDLVIVDTLRRAARGKEMENPGDAQEIIELLDDLRSVRYGTSVLALGHPTKTQPDQPAGAGVVQDALPVIHRMTRTGEEISAAIVDLVTTKSKDGPTGRIASFAMKPIGESLVFVPLQA